MAQSHPCPVDLSEQCHRTNLSSFVSFWNSNKLHNSIDQWAAWVTGQAHVSLDTVTKEERVFIQDRTEGLLDGGGNDGVSWFCGEGLRDVGMKWSFKNCDPSWGGGEVRVRGSFSETGRLSEALICELYLLNTLHYFNVNLSPICDQ